MVKSGLGGVSFICPSCSNLKMKDPGILLLLLLLLFYAGFFALVKFCKVNIVVA